MLGSLTQEGREMVELAGLVCLSVFGTLLLPFLFMFYRNNVVYNYRVQWLDEDCGLEYAERHRRYDSLPSYDTMMWQLFTFNWDYCWDGTKKK